MGHELYWTPLIPVAKAPEAAAVLARTLVWMRVRVRTAMRARKERFVSLGFFKLFFGQDLLTCNLHLLGF